MANKEVPILKVSAITNVDLEKPQIPTQPWEIWLAQKCEIFDNWTKRGEKDWSLDVPPNMPEQFQAIHGAIISEYWIPGILQENLKTARVRGGESTGIFYRPGLGATGVMEAILGKIGNFRLMVITDPVYERRLMEDWAKGVLPLDYYAQIVTAMGAKNLAVQLRDDQQTPGQLISKDQLPLAEIPKKGAAVLDFNLNGVDLSVALLPNDATKFTLDRYGILALGQPTPLNKVGEKPTVTDPRYSESFSINGIKHLEIGGIIDYSKLSFGFIPRTLAPSVLGLQVLEEIDHRSLVQKIADYPERLEQAWKASNRIREALGVLAGSNPEVSYMGYYHQPEQSENDYLQTVMAAYRSNLNYIRRFMRTLPEDAAKDLFQRFEFLLLGPIAKDGQLDEDRIRVVHLTPDDPDDPTKERHYGPYFGRPGGLIDAHNSGQINVYIYYQQVINEFNKRFSKFRDN